MSGKRPGKICPIGKERPGRIRHAPERLKNHQLLQ
jgi:hypothetical protein